MSGFKALNIESDDESDVEVDDTKEIQIEETLKLYQTALKFHSEGPSSFNSAADAYRELFESEIFQYPESQTELRRIELYGPGTEIEDDLLEYEVPKGFASGNLETNNSTLPQILHLSHKNYAQFRLEALASKIDTLNVSLRQILTDASAALDHFVQALDKDATDLDLWRRTATVGELLNNKRAARFCLEAVLDGDEEGLTSLMTLPGLEDGIAGEQLRELVATLGDQLSVLQAPLPPKSRKLLSRMLKQRLDPYHSIVSRRKALLKENKVDLDQVPQQQRALVPAPKNWVDLGDALLRHHNANQYSSAPLSAISFDLADAPVAPEPPKADTAPLPGLAQVKHENIFAFMPTSIHEQFPGLDHGAPTVQPRISDADAEMRVISRPGEASESNGSSTVSLPTRKRSGDAAGLVEGGEEGRTKSRRTRGRESILDLAESKQSTIDANTQWEFEQQLNERKAADDWLYETTGVLFERVGVSTFEGGKNVRGELEPSSETSSEPGSFDPGDKALKLARSDFSQFLNAYNDRLAHLLLVGGEDFKIGKSSSTSGSASSLVGSSSSKAQPKFDTMPSGRLFDLLRNVNDGWLSAGEVAYMFSKALTSPDDSGSGTSAYARYSWSESLKTIVVRTLVNFDGSIFETAAAELENFQRQIAGDNAGLARNSPLPEFLLTIFELHLDIFCLIKEANSGVDEETVALQGDRLHRWSDLAREVMHARTETSETQAPSDQLNLRFLWATTLHIGALADVDQDYALECMQDLRRALLVADEFSVFLPNNAVMPEISIAAIDRKISELTTKDFFAKVTENEMNDPLATIENLEPLLESLEMQDSGLENDMAKESVPQHVPQDLVDFLAGSSMSVRLMLWQRLREAYMKISYTPMVVVCYFRMMRMILNQVKCISFLELEQEERQMLLLKTMRMVDVMVARVFALSETSEDAWEYLDETGLPGAIALLGELLHILQVFNVFEDSIQIGQTKPPSGSNDLPVPSFALVTKEMQETQIKVWTILYRLLKEGIAQNPESYPSPLEDRFDFLRCLHRNLGLRGICDGVNRKFVRMIKDEFFQMTHVDGYDQEQAQVLYDLYGLNCFMNPSYELIEHRCTHDAFLDKGVALQAVDLLLLQAGKLPIKDLVKHTLKDTIEKVHGALNRKKPTAAILSNREVYRAFLRSPIKPTELFRCLRGDGDELMITEVPESDAVLASKGWYFLMGHIALTRFRTTKKPGGTPQEDVDIAIAFFMQDLEYSMENWQTWFRLAQAYDTKIDENVMWSAEKMNNEMNSLVQLQRAAIHCYAMATALAHQLESSDSDLQDKIAELHHDFGMRIYNSCRAPLSMRAFAVNEDERFLSVNGDVVRTSSYKPLRVYTALKLARTLLLRTLQDGTETWTLHYMLAKCLWKMHSMPHKGLAPSDKPPAPQEVFRHIIQALKLVPGKNSRDSKAQPTLEPHYKLLILVHKMFIRGSIELQVAQSLLYDNTYAKAVPFPESKEEWPKYVLAVLKRLRAADKQNWHHRMIYRTAQIIHDYPESSQDFIPRQLENEVKDRSLLGQAGARHELTLQMFTKTMVLQVWRPDAERPGRHFVYTTRYTRFFVKILESLRDRANLEQLARRVRRRNHELYEHTAVWQDICNAYLRILRDHAILSEGLETSTFSNVFHDEFLERKELLEPWMQAQENGTNAALDVLRESQELKRINQGLVKPGPIDDLTGDAYAFLFKTVAKNLHDNAKRDRKDEAPSEAPPPSPPRQEPPPPPPARNPTMSVMHLMNIDGASGQATPNTETTPAPQAPTPSAQDSTAAAAAPAWRRKLGVGRREIRNAAESCYPKTPAQTASRVVGPVPESRVQVVINTSRPALGGDMSVETSAPGSIHDSADDESELSELEEEDADDEDEGARRPFFPGLVGREKTEPEDSEMEVEGDETAEEGREDVEMGEVEGEGQGEGEGEGDDGETEPEPGNGEAQEDMQDDQDKE